MQGQTEFDCLVTGATGFLGRAVVAALLTKGASVRCLVREASGNRLLLLSGPAQPPRSQILCGNLLSPARTSQAVEGVRVVYHLAAEMRGLPATIFAGTVVGSKNLLQSLLRARPERVVLISSLNVYGLANVHPRTVITEDFFLDEHPEKRDVYTHAKIWQEHLFREYLAGSGIELTILRPGFIYGPSQTQLPARLGFSLGGFFFHANARSPLPATYVENCADAVVWCGGEKQAGNQAYNVIDDCPPTGFEYLEQQRRLAHRPRMLRTPFAGLSLLCYLNRLGNKWSAGQIPLALTGYRAASCWRGHRFSNQKLKSLGWRQPILTKDALARAFPPPVPTVQSEEPPVRSAA
jgi:nucleoside-diphosphate-sugar epimerase